MKIDGRNITKHPLGGPEFIEEYYKTATVFAVETTVDGFVSTPEGDMDFKEGDYILTDNPPTHAWPVQRKVFLRTYARVE
jgi:hypothetical protein